MASLTLFVKEGMSMTNLVVVGEIVNTHGVNGEVRVISRTDFPEKRYAKGTSLVVKHRDSDAEMKVTVAQYRTHKNFDLLRFENYNSIHDVEQFKGATLYIHTNDLEPLDKNEFYYYEIIGCTVITEDNQQLGKVVEIFETGANDIW